MSASAEVVPPVLENNRVDPSAAAGAKAQATVEQHRKRGRPAGSGSKSSAADQRAEAKARAEAQAKILEQNLQALYSPEHWKGICRAPADLMLATSGNQIWDIPEGEIDTLAEQASITARFFLATDPKWVALALFGFSLATTYGTRAMMHVNAAAKAKKGEK